MFRYEVTPFKEEKNYGVNDYFTKQVKIVIFQMVVMVIKKYQVLLVEVNVYLNLILVITGEE